MSSICRQFFRLGNQSPKSARCLGAGLLDLAEGNGSATAADRLKAREEEKVALDTRLHRLCGRRERGRLMVSEEVVDDAIEGFRGSLTHASVTSLRRVLKTFV
jgi:hypothetical protein